MGRDLCICAPKIVDLCRRRKFRREKWIQNYDLRFVFCEYVFFDLLHCYRKSSCSYSCEGLTITVAIGAYS